MSMWLPAQRCICHRRELSHLGAGYGPASCSLRGLAASAASLLRRECDRVVRAQSSCSALQQRGWTIARGDDASNEDLEQCQPQNNLHRQQQQQQHSALAASLGQLPPEAVLRLLQQHPGGAGLSTSQLSTTAISLSSALMLSPMQALAMVLKRPLLVRQSAADVAVEVQALARMVGMEACDAAPLVAQQPALLDMPADTLRSDVARLSATLEVSSTTVLLILSRCRGPALTQLLGMPQAELRQRLQGLREVLASRFGGQQAAALLCQVLVTRWPDLLVAVAPEQVEASLSVLVRMLQVPKRHMMTVLTRCPPLLCASASELVANYKGALLALRIDVAAVTNMLVAEPRLLLLDAQRLRSRVDAMQFGLYLPRKQALDMLVCQPQLLLYQPAVLVARLADLMHVLAVQHEVAIAMLRQHPILLMYSRRLIEGKLALLHQLFGLTPMHARELVTLQPRVLSFSAERLRGSWQTLTQLLSMPEKHLAVSLMVWPMLLLAPPTKIQGKVRDLCALLAVDEQQGAMLVRSHPDLACQDMQLWQTNFDSLATQLGLTLSQIRQLALAKPQLLSQAPRRLLQRCMQLAVLANTSSHWRHTLDTAPGAAVVALLACDARALHHLAYLAAAGLQAMHPGMLLPVKGPGGQGGAPSYRDTTLLHASWAFEARHRAFRAWRAQRARELRALQRRVGMEAGRSGSAAGGPVDEAEDLDANWQQGRQQLPSPWVSDNSPGGKLSSTEDERLLDFMLSMLRSGSGASEQVPGVSGTHGEAPPLLQGRAAPPTRMKHRQRHYVLAPAAVAGLKTTESAPAALQH